MRGPFFSALFRHPKGPKSQVLCQGALALTPSVPSHGQQAVVGNIPQVLRGHGQRKGLGCDGGGLGTQEPRTCLLPQE